MLALAGILLPSVLGSHTFLPRDHLGNPVEEIHGLLEEKVGSLAGGAVPVSVAIPDTAAPSQDLSAVRLASAAVAVAPLPRVPVDRLSTCLFHRNQPPSGGSSTLDGSPAF